MMKIKNIECDMYTGTLTGTLECGEKVEIPFDAWSSVSEINRKNAAAIEELREVADDIWEKFKHCREKTEYLEDVLKQWKDKAIALDAETMHMSGEIIRLNNENKNLRITINKMAQVIVGDD